MMKRRVDVRCRQREVLLVEKCAGFFESSLERLALVAVGNINGHAIGIEDNRGFRGLSLLFRQIITTKRPPLRSGLNFYTLFLYKIIILLQFFPSSKYSESKSVQFSKRLVCNYEINIQHLEIRRVSRIKIDCDNFTDFKLIITWFIRHIEPESGTISTVTKSYHPHVWGYFTTDSSQGQYDYVIWRLFHPNLHLFCYLYLPYYLFYKF